ncbi:hypothetical protein OTC26_025530 [Streptomyces tirandamycinicus]|nr:hypothetical protein [Streptomyces tirandamycinicus]MCY0983903.1 hypothetical protein [Streptomyces tirandamycinicus]
MRAPGHDRFREQARDNDDDNDTDRRLRGLRLRRRSGDVAAG